MKPPARPRNWLLWLACYNPPKIAFTCASLLMLVGCVVAQPAGAQDVFTPGGEYTPVQSSFDAWQSSDARHQAEVQDQLFWNDTYRQQLLWEARWYEYHRPFYRVLPNPWVPRLDQPVGREEVQTGPNRWESRPVYAEPVGPELPLVVPQPQPENLPAPPSSRPRPSRPRRGIEF